MMPFVVAGAIDERAKVEIPYNQQIRSEMSASRQLSRSRLPEADSWTRARLLLTNVLDEPLCLL